MKDIKIKVPQFGMAIAIDQKDWGKKIAAEGKVNTLHDHIVDQLTKAMKLQQDIGVVGDSKGVNPKDLSWSKWNAAPNYQILFMRFKFEGHDGTIFCVLIPKQGDNDSIEYVAYILLEDPIYFIEAAKTYDLDLTRMPYDESIGFLVDDLEHPIIKHILDQVHMYEKDPIKAIDEDRVIADDKELNDLINRVRSRNN